MSGWLDGWVFEWMGSTVGWMDGCLSGWVVQLGGWWVVGWMVVDVEDG